MVEKFPQVQLLNVYIVEAHPADGWQVEANENEDDGTGNLCFMQPRTLAARLTVAGRFVQDMKLDPSSVVVDGIENETDLAFEARAPRASHCTSLPTHNNLQAETASSVHCAHHIDPLLVRCSPASLYVASL